MEFYPESAWTPLLFVGGYNFETPPPMVTPEGIVPFPPTGSRKLHARTTFFYGYTGITPAMCMRLTGIGSQYLVAFKDANGAYLQGDAQYAVNLPPDIPEGRFWSLTLYDNQTRSDRSGADEIDAEHQSTDLAVGVRTLAGPTSQLSEHQAREAHGERVVGAGSL